MMKKKKHATFTLKRITLIIIFYASFYYRFNSCRSRKHNGNIHQPDFGACQLAAADGYCISNRKVRRHLQADRCEVKMEDKQFHEGENGLGMLFHDTNEY